MSLFRAVKKHLLVFSGGGTPGTSALIGMNMNIPEYENNSKPYASYLAYAERWEYENSTGGWGPLPDSYLISVDGWPNSAPSLDPGGNYTFRRILSAAPSAPQTVNVTWAGNVVSMGYSGGTITSTGGHSATFVISLDMSTADPASTSFPIFSYTITPGDANYAKNFFIAATGVTLAEPTYVADMAEMVTGPIRMMDPANVNGNMGIWPSSGNGTTTFPSPTVTAANRNTPTGGNWGVQTVADSFNGNVYGHDGWPIEVQFALARAVGQSLWTSLQPNGSDDYFDLIATWIRDYETTIQPGQTTTQPWPTGAKIYLQNSNETWNSGFPYLDQLNEEGTARGFGTPAAMRNAQRSSEIFRRFELILGPAGKMNRIVRILDFQESGNPSLVDTLMPWNTGVVSPITSGSTTHDHHDMITAAAYWDVSNYTGNNLTTAFSLVPTAIDTIIAINVAYKAKADSYGLLYGSYEGGNGTTLDGGAFGGDRALYRSFIADPRMQGMVAYFLQQWAAQLGPNVPMCWYAYAMRESGGQDWGIKNWTGGPDTPSSTALKNFKNGLVTLQPLSGAFVAALDMTVGTVLGTVTRRTAGSTLVLSGTTNLTVNSTTGNITLANTSGLVVGTPISFTITESHPSGTNSPLATNFSCAVYGNQKVTNGSFSSSSGWTTFGNTIAGGVITCASAGQICQQPMDYVNGATYQLTLTYNQTDAATTWGELRVNLGAANGANVVVTSSTISGPGTLTLNFTANVGAGNYLTVEAAAAAYTGTLDNISLRQTS